MYNKKKLELSEIVYMKFGIKFVCAAIGCKGVSKHSGLPYTYIPPLTFITTVCTHGWEEVGGLKEQVRKLYIVISEIIYLVKK